MFVISIFGGLGSQMDQYSFSLALKKHYPEVNIKYDIFNLYPIEHNGYELKRIFNLSLEEASIGDIKILSEIYPPKAKYARIMSWLFFLRQIIMGHKDSYIKPDDASAYYDQVFKLNPLKSYLFFGNWMHENYRKDIEKEIKAAFTFPDFDDAQNKEIAKKIETTNSVSIHVRHGDYKKYGFPMMPLGYYKKAIETLESKHKDLEYFIFSDDIDYVRKEFHFLKNYTIVDFNKKENSYRDMQLMSLCKHNIIANSSFSYWGAFLNKNKNAIIISPKFHEPSCKYPFAKSDWIILDNHKLQSY